jgi:hypothetical protein
MLSLWSKNWTGLIMSCGATGRCIVLYQRKTRSIQKEAETTRSGYSKALEYKYRVKTVALGTLKRYYIISFTLYLEWYRAYSIVGSGGPH